MGKLKPGILKGQLRNYGNAKECYETKHVANDHVFSGQMCTVHFEIDTPIDFSMLDLLVSKITSFFSTISKATCNEDNRQDHHIK